jgi:elongator complex protein 3
MRIQRDIPANKIEEGVKKSNLRELVEEQIRKKGIKSNEIRTREVGLLNKEMKKEDFSIRRIDYEASDGKEVFLSMEDNEEDLAGFIRLRIPSKNPIREEITSETGLIRELHIYGSEVPISKEGSVQHSGFGSTLLKEAERIAQDEFGMKKMIIISGVGVREYYKKHKYVQIGPYVGKDLK